MINKILILLICMMIIYYIHSIQLKIDNFIVNNNVTSEKKIAFCFLIYDEINHEELWYDFFKNIDPNKYNIYIHYKKNVPLKYFEEFKLPYCIDTKYADVSLIHAMNLLFRTAYEKDSNNYKFVMLSNSCIPLKNFNYIYDFLTKDNYSYFNKGYTNIPHFKLILQQYIDPKYVDKSYQWNILNRNLVEILAYVDENIINTYFKYIYAPEEIYYYTFVKLYNLEDQLIVTDDVSVGATTFTNWNHFDYKYFSLFMPYHFLKNYSEISIDEYNYLLNSSSLFGRKFNKNFIIKN